MNDDKEHEGCDCGSCPGCDSHPTDSGTDNEPEEKSPEDEDAE